MTFFFHQALSDAFFPAVFSVSIVESGPTNGKYTETVTWTAPVRSSLMLLSSVSTIFSRKVTLFSWRNATDALGSYLGWVLYQCASGSYFAHAWAVDATDSSMTYDGDATVILMCKSTLACESDFLLQVAAIPTSLSLTLSSTTTTTTTCAAGQYAETSGSTTCTACPAGKHNAFSGAVGSSSCEYCDYGKYSSSSGSALCTNCPTGKAGQYQGITACSTLYSFEVLLRKRLAKPYDSSWRLVLHFSGLIDHRLQQPKKSDIH